MHPKSSKSRNYDGQRDDMLDLKMLVTFIKLPKIRFRWKSIFQFKSSDWKIKKCGTG